MSPTARDIGQQLRTYQESHPVLGPLFVTVHGFIDRTIDVFFEDDAIMMPRPLVAFEKIYSDRVAEYHPMDGYTLTDRITVDPFKVNGTALAAAETIAHELVHVWQQHLGYPMVDNCHEISFHDKMKDYGIATSGPDGIHVGYIGDIWSDWLVQNADLGLDKITLGPIEGMPVMSVWKCPDCGFMFVTHDPNPRTVCATKDCWEEMEEV